MPKLSKWIREKIRGVRDRDDRLKSSEPSIPYGLPILPAKRQHVLTPSPSHKNLSFYAVAKGAFFQRLPLELRRQIYIAAFGNRTVHMDLRYDYHEPPGPRHARLKGDCMCERDRTVPPDWRWWSSVCHRNPLDDVWLDQCRLGENNAMCFLFPGEWPDKCFLGVMGWLLTCRQA
jgi:2EXR family